MLLNTAGDRMRRVKIGRHRATDLGIDLAQDGAVNDLIRPGGARDAVEAGLLDIFLMPQVATQTGALVGAEALIRYLDPERGIEVQPASFVPALEDMGEIADVDFFALTRACETVARWQREGRAAVPIAVNFSRMTVGEEGFVDRVAETVARFGVDPSLIEIEVTESARGRGGDLLRCVADDLRGRGFSVAVDDFGVDNANVSLFVQLEFDVLKMDRSLIWGHRCHGSHHARGERPRVFVRRPEHRVGGRRHRDRAATGGAEDDGMHEGAGVSHREAVRYRRVRAAVHGVRTRCAANAERLFLWALYGSNMSVR